MESGEFKSGKTRVFGCEFVQSFMGGPEECIIPPGHTRFLSNVVNFDNQEGNERRNLAVVNGTRTILVVRVIATDGNTTADEATLASNVFDDSVNVAKQYSACSHGKLNFTKADNRALTGTNDDNVETDITNGVTTVKIPVLINQGPDTMNNAITLALKQNFGGVSSPNELADHVMYCFPPGTMGGIAYGYVDHWNTNYNNQWCGYLSTQMHEIGHNLNLGHSDEGPDEYADQTGMVSDGKILTDSILYKDMTLTTVLMHKFLLADGVLLWRG
jgi:hypothetical protein